MMEKRRDDEERAATLFNTIGDLMEQTFEFEDDREAEEISDWLDRCSSFEEAARSSGWLAGNVSTSVASLQLLADALGIGWQVTQSEWVRLQLEGLKGRERSADRLCRAILEA